MSDGVGLATHEMHKEQCVGQRMYAVVTVSGQLDGRGAARYSPRMFQRVTDKLRTSLNAALIANGPGATLAGLAGCALHGLIAFSRW